MRERKPLLIHEAPGDDIALHLTRAWAESTLTLIEQSRSVRQALRDCEADKPDPEDPRYLQRVRAVWTTECLLVMSAWQLQQWIARLYRLRNRRPPREIWQLNALRNAIEHLDEARLDDDAFTAFPGPRSTHGVGRLPGAALPVSLADDDAMLFGVITSGELDELARGILRRLAQEQSEYIQDMLDWFRRIDSRGASG